LRISRLLELDAFCFLGGVMVDPLVSLCSMGRKFFEYAFSLIKSVFRLFAAAKQAARKAVLTRAYSAIT
jgi:hypothetical protein